MIGTCTVRNEATPTSHIITANTAAIAALVAMVLSHGCQPARIKVNGSRNRQMNT